MEALNLEIINQYKDMLGADMFLETISLYEQQASEYFIKLAQAIQDEDYAQWKDSCHILKSASGNVGLKDVYEKVKDLEYSKESFEYLSTQLSMLKTLNDDGLVAVKKWLAQG